LSPVIVLSYNFWQTRFGGDPTIIDKTMLYDGHPVTIVGITPKGFHGLFAIADMQGYLPMGMQQIETAYDQTTPTNRANRFLLIYGRLKSGVTLAKASLR
jgi:hypothetical protein